LKKTKRIGNLPLSTLIEILEGEGFRISIDQRIKLQTILSAFSKQVFEGELEDLRFYIRPLICKSLNQQIVFDSAFDKYKRYIEDRSNSFHKRLKEKDKKEKLKKRLDLKKVQSVVVGIVFLISMVVAYYWRKAPIIHTQVTKQWTSPGDSVRVQSILNGKFMAVSLSLNDTSISEQNIFFAENDTLVTNLQLADTGIYKVALKAQNFLTDSIISDSIEIKVCDKPIVEKINHFIDLNDPLLVDFEPTITSHNQDLSFTWKINGSEKSRGRGFTYQFPESGEYLVELVVKHENSL
jgi:hypothetical protein